MYLAYGDSVFFQTQYWEHLPENDLGVNPVQIALSPEDSLLIDTVGEVSGTWLSVTDFWSLRCFGMLKMELHDLGEEEQFSYVDEILTSFDQSSDNEKRFILHVFDACLASIDEKNPQKTFFLLSTFLSELFASDQDYANNTYHFQDKVNVEWNHVRDFLDSKAFIELFVSLAPKILLETLYLQLNNTDEQSPRYENVQRAIAFVFDTLSCDKQSILDLLDVTA